MVWARDKLVTEYPSGAVDWKQIVSRFDRFGSSLTEHGNMFVACKRSAFAGNLGGTAEKF